MKIEIKHRDNGMVLFSAEIGNMRLCIEVAIKHGADLYGADLRGARGINKLLTTPLYLLLDQPGKIKAYKLVNNKYEGIYKGGIRYQIGDRPEVLTADTYEEENCAAGISLASMDWCISEYRDGYKIMICEFEAGDIAAIPIGSDGKFRVFRCEVVAEKDLAEIGMRIREE